MGSAHLKDRLLAFAGVGLLLAYLLPNHYPPWASFHADVLAAAALVPLVIWSSCQRGPVSPLIVGALLIALVPLLQLWGGSISFAGDAFIACLYITGFSLAVFCGARITAHQKGPNALHALIPIQAALVLAGVLSTGIALHQWLNLGLLAIFIVELPPGYRPFANLAQPNQLATLLMLGLIANVFLYEARNVRASIALLASAVLGFGTTSLLQLYYSKKVTDSKTSILKEFSIDDISKQFNRISLDRTGTIIKDLPGTTGRLSSNLTENKAFIQSGTGLACRIDFPGIKELKYITEKGAIVDAQLIIRPVNNTYSKSYPLADSLNVYVADQLNRLSGTLNSATGSPIYAVLNKAQDEFDENIGYTIPLGTFMQNEMVKKTDSKSALILTIPNISKGVNRLVLGNQKNTGNKVKLKIYYISY